MYCIRTTRAAVLVCAFFLSGTSVASAGSSAKPPSIQLYALDCGRIVFDDMTLFSDTDDYDGKPGMLADPCFLIRHPRGILLWDTGLGDKIAQTPGGFAINGIRLYEDVTLQAQLQKLELTPDDISYVAFSHLHFDHVGNANSFANVTWIINKTELEAALGPNPPFGDDASTISAHDRGKMRLIDGDFDVFGDGTVRILKMPGHTPGHQALALRLSKAGVVLLSGDLYHTRDNRRLGRIPRVNTSRSDTLASMDRFERLVTYLHARVIVQHDENDFHDLPPFPGHLD